MLRGSTVQDEGNSGPTAGLENCVPAQDQALDRNSVLVAVVVRSSRGDVGGGGRRSATTTTFKA